MQAEVPQGKILHRVPIELPAEQRDVPSRCHGIGVTPDGKEVWVCDVNHELVAVFDVTADPPKQITLVPTKGHPYWMTISPDGKYSYISNTDAEVVQVVEVDSLATLLVASLGVYFNGRTTGILGLTGH